jgi:hypothetical protein
MTIRLGDLRVFAREIASHDVSGSTANREVQYWINSALARIWSAHAWTWARSYGQITLEQAKEGYALTVVEGGRALVLVGETFKQEYLDNRWHMHVDGEDSFTFELAEIVDPNNALMVEGLRWVLDGDTGVDYTWSRHIYPLPDNAKEITRLRVAQGGNLVDIVLPHQFDSVRQQAPTQRGDAPVYATVRRGNLEVWPAPSSSWKTLELTYKRKPPRYNTADHATNPHVDDTDVDWPEEWVDLLHKGIILEAAKTQGKNSPVPVGTAEVDFISRLTEYKGEDSGIADLNGPMGVRPLVDPFQLTGRPSTIPDAT